MARLYVNENFPFPIVEHLRRWGHDILTSHEANNANRGIPDLEVLRFSRKRRRVLLTLNRRDFISLHKKGEEHEGIIVCRTEVDFATLADRVHEAMTSHNPLRNKLIRVNRTSTRVDVREV